MPTVWIEHKFASAMRKSLNGHLFGSSMQITCARAITEDRELACRMKATAITCVGHAVNMRGREEEKL
jgi:hypothetical protein